MFTRLYKCENYSSGKRVELREQDRGRQEGRVCEGQKVHLVRSSKNISEPFGI